MTITTITRHRCITTKLLLLLLLLMTGAGEVWGAHSYYSQNYEDQSDASLWSSANHSGGLSLVTDDATYGKYILFTAPEGGLSGPRTAYTNFSVSEWPYSSYTIEFDAALRTCNTTNHCTELVVASDGYELEGNKYFVGTNEDKNNFLFMLRSNGVSSTTTYLINNTANSVTIAENTWFHVKLNVNITNTTVSYTISGGATASGTYNVTDGTSMEAKSLVATIGKGYYGTVKIDNIAIYSTWYYLKTDIPTTLVSTGGAEGVTVTHPYPHYVLSGTTLYRYPSTGVNPNYGKTFTLTSTDNQEFPLTSDGTISNVVAYREAEDFMTPISDNNNLYIRCSNTQGAYASAYVDALTLPQGVYTLTTASYANSSTTFSFKVGNDVVFTQTGNGGWRETSSGNIQIHANTPVQVIGGSRNYALDYVYAQAQFAYMTASGELAKGSTSTPTLTNSLSMDGHTISYASSNQGVATVNASTGEITANHNGTAVITASYINSSTSAVEYTATYTVTVTGETAGTYTLTPSPTTMETFTVTGAGMLPQTIDGNMMSLSFGADNEVQVVETVGSELGVRGIDTNNYSHVYVSADIPTMGSYFAITPKQNGVLSFRGYMNDANAIRLTDADGNILERISASNVTTNNWANYTFGTLLNSGDTYYLFAETQSMTLHDDDTYPTLYLNNLTLTKTEGTTINLIDQSLLFYPENNGNFNRLDRSIPGFDITFMGDGFKYQNSKNFIVRYKENGPAKNYMKITPRLASGESTDVVITGVTLLYSNAISSPKVTIAGTEKTLEASDISCAWTELSANDITITLTNESDASFLLKAVSITYSLNNGATLSTSKQDVNLRFEKEYVYGYEGEVIENKFWVDTPKAYYGDVTFYGNVSYYGSGSGFSNGNTNEVSKIKDSSDNKTYYRDQTANPDEEYKVRIGQGVCVLEASTPATTYFNAGYGSTRLYSRDYVEERQPGHELVLAPNAEYTVPAASGLSFKVTTSGGSISLTGTDATPSTALTNDQVFSTTANATSVTIKNTGDADITIKKIEVSRKKPTIDFGYIGAAGAGSDVLFPGSSTNPNTYTPNAFTIMDEKGETDLSSYYADTGTYAITQAVAGVNINKSTGVLTVTDGAANGVLKVTLTVNPENEYKATYAPLTKTLELKVVDGMWDFRTYSRDEHRTMYNSDGWSGSYGGWYASRDNAEFEDIIRNDGTPLPRALALQTMGKHRLLHTDHGYLHLQGKGIGGTESANGGGQLRIPVKADMLVEINSYSGDLLSEMEIDGVTDIEGNDVTMFYVNPSPASQYFIAKSDGYIIVRNPSTNLDLHICYIKSSADMAFKYGEEDESGNIITYVDAGAGKWTNPVMNQGTTTIAYSCVNNINAPVTSIDEETGEVTLGGAYGQFTGTATGSGTGLLAGKTRSYIANVIGLNFKNASHNLGDANANTFDLISSECIESCKNTSGEDDDGTLKSKIVFSLVDASPSVTLSGSTLTIGEVGTVTVKATLGSIEKTFTCTLNGGTISFSIDGGAPVTGTNIVIPNTTNTLTITVSGDGVSKYTDWGDVYFDRDEMERQALGDIKRLAVPESGEDPTSVKDSITTSETGNTLTITFDHSKVGEKFPGGVIPIIGKYVYGGKTYDITGTVTVAYTSHVWRFQHNLLTGMDSAGEDAEEAADHLADDALVGYGSSHGLTGGLGQWKTNDDAGSYTIKTNTWGTGATIDEPTDNGTKDDNYNWKFVRKIGGHTESPIIYYYNHAVEGQNALVIPETEGLQLFASPSNKQLGVSMARDEAPYDCRNLMLLRGGKLTIPLLKKGQWVEVRWTRHKEEMGERILMTNLSDVDGTAITSTYKIGNCFYNLPWSTSTYMFQATEDGDVTFEVADNIYVSIQEIILHDPDKDVWPFKSSISTTLKGYDDATTPSSDWTGLTAPDVKWVYLWDDDAASHTLTFLTKDFQNAPNAPQKWTFELDDMLKREGAVMTTTGVDNGEATLTYKGGWGKAKVTMTCYSQNMKYVANKKTWTLTFGQAPKQTYPYTWDFTKFFSSTLGSTTNENSWAAVAYVGSTTSTTNPLRVALYNNHTVSNYGAGGYANTYNTDDYQSYYVEGGQLVSYGLRNTNNGIVPETAGLGFILDVDGDANHQPDQNMLMLNMTNNITSAQQAVNGQTWITDTGDSDAKKHTDNSHLTIGSGGKVIVPKPNDEVNYANYYIYIKSSHEPSGYTNVVKMVDESAGANEAVDEDYDVPTDEGVYKYRFNANEDAVFTFTSSDEATDGQLHSYIAPVGDRKYTDIYAIAVTKDFKTVKRLNGVGWATESRNYAVDYSLDSLLTTQPLQAYSVIARSSNPIYSVNKTKTTVRLQDRNYVVPARQGLVLKQVTGSPEPNGSTYTVPLFVPAVTTAIEPDYTFTNNLMRPNLNERPFTTECEDADGTDNGSGEYTRFILSEKYMTWRKEGDAAASYDTQFTSGTVPGFYRLHIYGDIDYDDNDDTATGGFDHLTGSNRNILGANKAYLVLPSGKINSPIWQASAPARASYFIGIEDVSDMEEITEVTEAPVNNATYNLSGQRVADDSTLSPGIYIRNGKKYLVK